MTWAETARASIALRLPQFMSHAGLNSTPMDREVLRAAMVKQIRDDIEAVMDALFEEEDE